MDKATPITKTYQNHRAKITKSTNESPETIEIPISSIHDDRDKDNFTEQGLQNMLDQLKTKTIGMYLDHGLDVYHALDMLGVFTDGEIRDGTLYAKADLDVEDARAQELLRKTMKGLPIGYSVAFIPLNYTEKKGGGRTFNMVDLLEVSAVGIPCNSGMTNPYGKSRIEAIVKNLLKENTTMTDKSDENTERTEAEENFVEAVNTIATYMETEPDEVLEALNLLKTEADDDEKEETEDEEKSPTTNNPDDEDQKEEEDDEPETDGRGDNEKLINLIDARIKTLLNAREKPVVKEAKPKPKRKGLEPKTIVLPDQKTETEKPPERKGLVFNPNIGE